MSPRISLLLLLLPGLAAADGNPDEGRKKARSCAACHAYDGNTPQPDWPKLAGQREPYLVQQLLDYRRGLRSDQYMGTTTQSLSDQDIADISAWYSSQILTSVEGAEGDPVGRQLYEQGDLARGIAACATCHGPDGEGMDQGAPGGMPSIAGQHQEWTIRALRTLAGGSRDNDHLDMMGHIASRLEAEDAEAIARYLETLP